MAASRILVAPSILAGDFSDLKNEAERTEKAGADWLHMDIMDGHFVDNISFGPAFVASVAKHAHVPLDVHLMIERPDHYFPRFVESAMNITVHLEAGHDVGKTLAAIRAAGRSAGLAINPETPLEPALRYLDQIDLLLVMTVHPGFGGQKFIAETMGKVAAAAELKRRNGWNFHIEVDGGITPETAAIAVKNGADVLVAGTSVFKATDMAGEIAELRGGFRQN